MSRTKGEAAEVTPRRRTWLRFRVGYIVILAAMAVFTYNFGKEAWADHQKGLQVAAASYQLGAERRSIHHLQTELNQAKSPAFILQQARDWGYVKPGEGLVSISYRQHPAVHAVHRVAAPRPGIPVWHQWWNAFFGSSR